MKSKLVLFVAFMLTCALVSAQTSKSSKGYVDRKFTNVTIADETEYSDTDSGYFVLTTKVSEIATKVAQEYDDVVLSFCIEYTYARGKDRDAVYTFRLPDKNKIRLLEALKEF
jgi:hypothetical protein